VTFNVMAGSREQDKSADDAAYGIVILLAPASLMAAPFLLTAYAWLAYKAWRTR
jgi:hypothetical protein